jgi:Tol biopolymer transport system component
MTLAAGTRIGGYEILTLIGAGGMGEVYRARDHRLARDVAVKIIAPSIAADPDGLHRFEREARLLASLNHPNIAAIYGVEDHGNQPALILELVEGETLADRIARGRLPIDEALQYARQITDALDTAHEAGIVHRDLKPGNIKITETGTVKVLDFGLAKAIAAAAPDAASDPSQSPTVTVHGTKGGVILGTAAYMSPEQARGKRIDKRTDIWAFGCVLYEMLTGRRVFHGETTSDVIAAIIERAPDLSQLPAAVPSQARDVIARCLEKDPKRRARDIADVAMQLAGGAVSGVERRSEWRPVAIAAAVTLAVAVAGTAAVLRWWPGSDGAPPPPMEFTFGAPANHTLTTATPTVSPDGRNIAFVVRDARQATSLWIRALDEASPRRLDGTENVMSPGVWSPDGSSLAFLVGDTWKRIPVGGGPPLTIVSGVVADIGASWGPDGMILLAPANRTGLARVPASGGTLEAVTTLDTTRENSHRWPQILPDGRHFLFTTRSDRPENLGIKLGSLHGRDVRALLNVPSPGKFAFPGWLLFMTPDEALMAQRFDPDTWTLHGAAQPIAASVWYNGPSFSGLFDVSRDGRVLVYTPALRAQSTLAWFDRSGKMLGAVGPERRYLGVRVSPDGRLAALELADERHGTRDIWILDTATNALTRLTANPATDWRSAFSPDGRDLVFASDRAGASTVFRVRVDGSGQETLLYRYPNGGAFPADWSRDGKQVLVHVEDAEGRRPGLVSVPVDGTAPVTVLAVERGNLISGRFCPLGDHVSYVSTATGDPEVYVMSIASQHRVRVSADGGLNPLWGRDHSELFFQDRSNRLMAANLDTARGIVAAPPRVLWQPCAALNRIARSVPFVLALDAVIDSTRFLARCDPADVVPGAITVSVNWQSRLR